MEEAFTKVIQQIFNNWTALKLAVDHSMGGPNGKDRAIECMSYMVYYCLYEHNVGLEKIQSALEGLMDEEFDTICEDESPKEIAAVLFRFRELLRDGNFEQCNIEFQQLPVMNAEWLKLVAPASQQNPIDTSSSDEDDTPENSESSMEDDGWTKVKSRRK